MGGVSNHEFIRKTCLSQIVLPRLFFFSFLLLLIFIIFSIWIQISAYISFSFPE